MPRFAANPSMLYTELDFLQRIGAAAEDGFSAVEYLFPYAYPKEQLAEQLQRHHLVQILHNLPAGDWAAGERGIAVLPDRVAEYIPGFHLNRTPQALALIAEVGAGQLFVQYDIYHMQRMEGELAGTIKTCWPHIAHLQLADNPGRHEPGSGEINYPFLFGLIDSLGYPGWIGCEYKPAAGTRQGLAWLAPFLQAQAFNPAGERT